MKKYLVILLWLLSLHGLSQITPSSVFRISNAAAQFGSAIPSGGILCDISTGKTYRVLRSLASNSTLTALVKDLDYKEFLTGGILTSETGSNGAWIKITNSDGRKDSVLLFAGTNMTSIVQMDDSTIVFNAAVGGSGATYNMSAESGSGGSWLKILGSDGSKDSVKLAAGTNMSSIVRTDANTITFNAASGGETYTMGTVAKATGAWIKILGNAGSKDSVFLKSGTGITVARYDNDTITVSAGATSLVGMVDDINFEFGDLIYGISQTWTLDIYASYAYTISTAYLEVDAGTISNVEVRIDGSHLHWAGGAGYIPTVDATVDATNAATDNAVAVGQRVTIYTTVTYTGAPSILRGKLKITRL